jgi:hypothetical protein
VAAGKKRREDLVNDRLLPDDRAAELVAKTGGQALRVLE